MNAVPILLTVSPILGNQGTPFNNFSYAKFIEASIHAAHTENIDIADANSEMNHHINGLSDEDQSKLMFSDNWHVNDFGHEIYARCLINKIILRGE